MLRIEEIIVPESVKNDYDATTPFNSLTDIRRLNAFVGPNNSGKSRLMRAMFLAGKGLMVSTDDEDARTVRDAVRKSLVTVEELSKHKEIFNKATDLLALSSWGFHACSQHLGRTDQKTGLIEDLISNVNGVRRNQYGDFDPRPYDSLVQSLQVVRHGIERLAKKSSSQIANQPVPNPPFKDVEMVYIPTLRGMRLGSNDEDPRHAYFDRTWSDYIKGKVNQPREESIDQARKQMSGKTVVTGLDLYDVLTDRLLGSLSDRQFIREYEEYLSKAFFRGLPVALVPRREHDTVNIKIGNEAERPIQSLGDGLQQIIILTMPMFARMNKPLLLFIEEPDLFLHPGYQRALINAIFDHPNPDLYVFVTTHSSQFLDVTLAEEGCSIFRLTKQSTSSQSVEHNPRFEIENVTFGDHQLLKHIGSRPSSVMFANCTIWVEGITDRLYYGHFLKLLLQQQGVKLIENLHYAFVEYGGGNITHWSFLDEEEGMDVERICSRLFLITDRDDGKDKRHIKLQSALEERFHRLEVREVENLLKPETIAAVILDYETEGFPLQNFSESAYRLNYLGKFIDDHVLVDKSKSSRFNERTGRAYADENGTIKDKVRFCQKALANIESIEDLSADALEVAQKLLRFVISEND